jgi:hypothetical protein
MTADTFLFNAGSIFFAAWIAVVAAVTITAFGRDLLPSETHTDSEKSHPTPGADEILRSA